MEPSCIVNSQEEYDRFVREVVLPRYKLMKADPSQCPTLEQIREEVLRWDREDALLDVKELKRSS